MEITTWHSEEHHDKIRRTMRTTKMRKMSSDRAKAYWTPERRMEQSKRMKEILARKKSTNTDNDAKWRRRELLRIWARMTAAEKSAILSEISL